MKTFLLLIIFALMVAGIYFREFNLYVHLLKSWLMGKLRKEFADHNNIVHTLKAKFYFAHPYASWERGLNENTNVSTSNMKSRIKYIA